jgi:hypothetical protein
MFSTFFFLKSCRLKDNVEEYRRARPVTDDNVGHKYRMLDIKATNTPSEYVILIVFSLQQWSHESASMLRSMYIACHLFNMFVFLNFTLVKFCIVFSSVHSKIKINISA